MAKYYRDYLKRIEAQMGGLESGYDRLASKQVQQVVPEINRARSEISDTLRREGASPLAKARFALDAEGRITDAVGKIYSQADIQRIAKEEQLSGERNKAEFMADQEKEAEKKAKKARTAQTWKTAAEIVGMGAGIASGVGIPAAMGIGKAAGGVADTVIGLDESYDSPELIAEGAGEIISGIISVPQAVSQQSFLEGMNNAMPIISKLPAAEMEKVMLEGLQAQQGGYQSIMQFLDKLEYATNYYNGGEGIWQWGYMGGE